MPTGKASENWKSWTLWTLLVALLSIDLFFATAHVAEYLDGTLHLHPEWSLEREHSYAETFQYSKWISIALSCAYLLWRRREAVYAAICVIFVYFLLDDSVAIHETIGSWVAPAFGAERIFRLRPQDFGELVVVAAAAIFLLAAFWLTYGWSRRPATRAFARQAGTLIVLLAAFGIGLDMLHSALVAGALGRTALDPVLVLLEDGGEMIVASVMAFWSTRCAVDERLEMRSP